MKIRRREGARLVFREHTYGVLVVSASEKFNSAMQTLLPMSGLLAAGRSRAASTRRGGACWRRSYDLVLINAPLPDDFGTRLATSICNDDRPRACCCFVKAAHV